MTKRYNSGRVQRLPQSGITSDRYEFLGLEQAEPDLGDPIVGVSSVEANPFDGSIYDWYLVGSDGSGQGKRYWLPKHIVLTELVRTAGSVTIRNNDTVIGFANGVSDLNFKGGISISTGGVSGIGNSAVEIEINSVEKAEQSELSSNLQGGSSGSIPYQESADTTVFLSSPELNENQVLSYDINNNKPIWKGVLDLNSLKIQEELTDTIYYLSYFVSTGTTSTAGINTSSLTFNPSQVKLGIGTDDPSSTLDVNGDLVVSGISTFTETININSKNGISTFISDSNPLYIQSDEVFLKNSLGTNNLAAFKENGSSELYYDSLKKFKTTGYGVTVLGTLESQGINITGISTFKDNVSISKTDSLLDVSSSARFTGITTIQSLTAPKLSDGVSFGTDLYVPIANNSGGWSWQPVYDAGAGKIDGIDLYENSEIKAETIVAIDFINPNYSISPIDGQDAAIVAFSTDPVFNSVSIGISSEVSIDSSGIDVSGIITSTKTIVGTGVTIDSSGINVSGIITSTKTIVGTGVTIDSSGINVSGFVTTTNLKVTNDATIDKDLTVTGNLTVNGNTTTINTTILTVDDKNIELSSTENPSDITADGGGITLKGDSDHTILWTNSTDSWDFSEHINLDTGKEYKINNLSVLSSTTLGSGVTNSSLKTLGTITSGTWQGSQIDDDYIGTINNENKVSLSALDIDGGNNESSISDNDLFIVDIGAGGTNKNITALSIKTYIGDNLSLNGSLSGDLDLNSKNITGTGNINITGIITASDGFYGTLTGTATTATNLNKSVSAGSGLTGGGTLTSNVTLNVGAGAGIAVNTDDIALKNAGGLTGNYVLKWDGTQLVNSNITDDGSLVTIGSTIKLNGIQDSGGSAGNPNYVPIANGSGGWSWAQIDAENISGTATTANNLNKDVLAGSGLTGGGTLTSNVTLNVGAGAGIAVNTDDIALKNAGGLTGNYVLKWDGTQLVNSNITDDGSLVTIGSTIKLNGIQDSTVSTGSLNEVPIANGSGGWSWAQIDAENISGIATTANNLNKDVLAGSGLTGGGTLTSNVTLNVGAGTGIAVNTNDIALKNAGGLTSNYVLKWDGNETQLVNSNITDDGSLVTIGSTIKLNGIQDSGGSAGNLNYVPIANGSGGWSWAQIDAENVSGSLQNIVDDTTPKLGGDLDLNSKNITGTGNINITGIITASDGFYGNLTGIATTATNLNKDVLAGSGLTGGGTLTSNVTLNVGAGTGIAVNTNDIALKNAGGLTSNYVLKWDGNETQLVNSNITDDGSLVGVGTSIKLGYGIFDKNNSLGANNNVPVSDGNGGWSWNAVGGIDGISVREETNSPFTGITELKFVGVNVTANANSNVATITVADTVSAATTAANLNKNVNTPLGGGLTGGGTLTSNLNIRLKNYDNLSTNTLLKWQGTNKELTNSLITENGSLVGVGTSIKLGYGIFDKNNSLGANNNVPVSDGNGGWSWNTVNSAGGIDGITISKGGNAISASSFTNINFVGGNITATDAGDRRADISFSGEFADFIVGIATTATTDALADGAGIKIGPNNTILYDHTNTAFRSSENFNLVSGKTYKINGTDVLTSNTLGSEILNSSLTSVGTLVKLDVGNINSTGIVTAATYDVSSDITLKDNVQIIENPLDKIVKIDGVTFNWKVDNKPSMGVIAQNIEEVLPELVSTGDTKHVNYNGIIGLLIEAIKELKSEIDELKGNK